MQQAFDWVDMVASLLELCIWVGCLRPALKMLCTEDEVEGRDLESWEVRMGSRSIAMEFGISFVVDVLEGQCLCLMTSGGAALDLLPRTANQCRC